MVWMVNLKVMMALGGMAQSGGPTVRRKFALLIGMVLFKTTEFVFNTNWRLCVFSPGGHHIGPSYVVRDETVCELFPPRQRRGTRIVREFFEYVAQTWTEATCKHKKGAHFKTIMKEFIMMISVKIENDEAWGGDEDYLEYLKYMLTHYDKLMKATEELDKRSWKKERNHQLKTQCQAKYDRACEKFNTQRNLYLEKMPRYEKVAALVDTELMNYGTILYNYGASQWNMKVAPFVSTWIRDVATKWEYITDEGPVFTTSQIVHLVMGLKHRKAMIEDAVKVEEVLVTTEEDELLVEEVGPKCGCFTNIFRRLGRIRPVL